MRLFSYIFVVALMLPVAAPASNDSITHINNQILAVKDSLILDKKQQEDQQNDLQNLEVKLAAAAYNYHKTLEQLTIINKTIRDLKIKAQTLETASETLKSQLMASLSIEYQMGNQPGVKVLLSQDDIIKAERLLTYYQYINAQRITQIDTLKQTLLLTQQNLAQQSQSYASLKQLTRQEQQQLNTLNSVGDKRRLLIKTINTQIQSQSQQLATLLSNKIRLENELRELSQNPLFFQASGKPFTHLMHHLSWPTKGTLSDKYDTQIDGSQLKWNGVLFNAPEDQPVYAVADGKVLFARWLPGYGLLMIIYHGQGYMTLYGRNHYLYKQTGDIVHAGDRIAAVGDSGGYEAPALYFAIRHNTLPVNPMTWLASRAEK